MDAEILLNLIKDIDAIAVNVAINPNTTLVWSPKIECWILYETTHPKPQMNYTTNLYSSKTLSGIINWLTTNKYILSKNYGQQTSTIPEEEPMPIQSSGPALWDKSKERFWKWAKNKGVGSKIVNSISKRMTDRDEYGLIKYGTRLQPFNGRNFKQDAISELLDALVYIEGMIYEEEERGK